MERGNTSKLVAVQQSFEGPFSGRALLIFPEAQSLELVRSIVGAEHSLEDVIDLEQEALAETGNIISECMLGYDCQCPAQDNADVTALGDPRNGATLFDTETPTSGGDLVMFLYIDFTIKHRDVRGFIALLMDLPSITALKEIVRDFIGGIQEQSGNVG